MGTALRVLRSVAEMADAYFENHQMCCLSEDRLRLLIDDDQWHHPWFNGGGMKLLTFQARHFSWSPHTKVQEDAEASAVPGAVEDAVVAWLHVEARDEGDRSRAFKHTLKHIKWIANKRGLRTVVLHFFAHLGGDNSDPQFAKAFIEALRERLEATGYTVDVTPYGYFCSWTLDVYGDSLAKVFKSI